MIGGNRRFESDYRLSMATGHAFDVCRIFSVKTASSLERCLQRAANDWFVRTDRNFLFEKNWLLAEVFRGKTAVASVPELWSQKLA